MGGAADARWLERHDDSGEGEEGGERKEEEERHLSGGGSSCRPPPNSIRQQQQQLERFCFVFLSEQGHSCCTCDRKYHKQKTLCVTELQPTASHSLEKH